MHCSVSDVLGDAERQSGAWAPPQLLCLPWWFPDASKWTQCYATLGKAAWQFGSWASRLGFMQLNLAHLKKQNLLCFQGLKQVWLTIECNYYYYYCAYFEQSYLKNLFLYLYCSAQKNEATSFGLIGSDCNQTICFFSRIQHVAVWVYCSIKTRCVVLKCVCVCCVLVRGGARIIT